MAARLALPAFAIPQGSWFERASVGSSPSSTAQDHVNIGTGDFPRNSGIIGHHMRIGNSIIGPFVNGPDLLIAPTLADLYDRSRSNKPLIGEVATVNIHLGMIGHGSMWGGGDGDFLVLRELVGASTQGAEGVSWNIPPSDARYFQYPGWVKDLPPLEHYFGYADRIDGTPDGLWRGQDISAQRGGFDTPARIPAQTRIIEELIRREGFGADAIPDMLMINYKLIDEIGHIWTMNSPQKSDSVRGQDEYMRRFVAFLNRQVGRGQWVVALTADHGATPKVAVSGAVQLSIGTLQAAAEARFDTDGDAVPTIEKITQTGIFVNTDELRQNGGTLDGLASWVLGLRTSDVVDAGANLTPQQGQTPAFQAFPSAVMADRPCLPEAKA